MEWFEKEKKMNEYIKIAKQKVSEKEKELDQLNTNHLLNKLYQNLKVEVVEAEVAEKFCSKMLKKPKKSRLTIVVRVVQERQINAMRKEI